MLLYIHPKEARKIVYPEGYFKGKHNLGFSVLKQMPKQLVDPLIIIKNPQKNRNGLESFGVFTEWITENGERVFAPIQVNAQGAISLQNNLASIFQIKEDNNYLNKLLGDNHQNVVYTKNNESADSLLSHGLIIPQAMRDDAYNAIIPDSTEKGNGKYSLQDTSPANLDEALVQNEVLRKNLYSAWETLAKYRDDKRVVNDPKAIRQLAKR